MKHKLHIITRCKKTADLSKIKKSIFTDENRNVEWHVIFDTSVLKDIPAIVLDELNHPDIKLHFIKGGSTYIAINEVISGILGGFIYLLSGDAELHPELYNTFIERIEDKSVFVFSQAYNGGKSFRNAFLQNLRPGHVDGSQYILKTDLFDTYQFVNEFNADGILIQQIAKELVNEIVFCKEVLSNHESLRPVKKARLPRILFIGKEEPTLTTDNPWDWESSELDVKYEKNDNDLNEILLDWNPDAIVTISNQSGSFSNLWNATAEIKSKWLNAESIDESLGERAYTLAMKNMLEINRTDLISFFTPMYNTGDKLKSTYESLKNQTYINWEWVLVNDSSDEGLTLRIAEEIASSDPRVKVYDFREKSNGLIGEAKYRACCMSRGEILVELDHDDIVTPDCAEYLHEAAVKFPKAGFFYSDAPEVDLNWNSNQYGEGFALGYGSYRTDTVFGREVQSSVTVGINPKTIRHIVGVPNHVRAWRRSTYFAVGGHARDLTIADDYELIVRTFLNTTMVHIPRTLYVQFLYNDGYEMNTQDLTRADIQRRVKTIMQYYNEAIKNRFEKDFGVEDWAYKFNSSYPIDAPCRYGAQEGRVNLTFTE
jgi:glycosyltransferase involved in cell wall biosynthesis